MALTSGPTKTLSRVMITFTKLSNKRRLWQRDEAKRIAFRVQVLTTDSGTAGGPDRVSGAGAAEEMTEIG